MKKLDIKIKLSERETIILTKIAKKNNINPEQYAKNIVRSFLKSQIRGEFQDKFNKLDEDVLAEKLGDIEGVVENDN